jgi:hypothetical protein
MSSQETQTQQQENGAFTGEVQTPTQQALAQRRGGGIDAAIRADESGVLRPSTFAEAMRMAGELARSSFVPKDFIGKPENILGAIMMGSEVGLAPMQAIQNIAVINGRPSVWGDMMLALCRRHPEWGGIDEDGDDKAAKCVVYRYERIQGQVVKKAYPGEFTIEEARHAKLLEKETPWKYYPKRMLKFRARGFALRDAFGDQLKGLRSAEEMRDVIDTEGLEVTSASLAEIAQTVVEAPAQPKKGADALREKLGKASEKAPEAPAAASQAQAAGPAAAQPSTPPPKWRAEVQKFIADIKAAKTYDQLDAISADLDQAKAGFSVEEQTAIAEAGKAAWVHLRAQQARR